LFEFYFFFNKGGFELFKGRHFFLQVLSALNFIHENNIIHGDIKPQNILIDDNGRAIICDFDVSKEETKRTLVTTTKSAAGFTLAFAAPEVLFLFHIYFYL